MSDKNSSNLPNEASNKNISPANKKNSKAGSFLTGLMAFLALMASGAGIAAGYYAWLELNKRIDQAAVDRQAIAHEIDTVDENAKLIRFKNELEENVTGIEGKFTDLSQKVDQQSSAQASIRKSTQDALQHVNRSKLAWGLKEVEHVLRMANHRLRIEQDIAGSIAALDAANSRLKELNDERLLPVRESISKQIGKLKNFPYPDWVGISLQLDNILTGVRNDLIRDAEKKQVINQKTKAETESEPEIQNESGSEAEPSTWNKFVGDIKNRLNKSIKVTREDQKLKLFISQQEKQRMYEFLRLKLLSAKYAVASRDNESFHRELEAAVAWLESTETLEGRDDLLNELTEMKNINLEPELPDITEANQLLMETTETIENS